MSVPKKKYYSIGDVAKHIGVKIAKIRYWETKIPRARVEKDRRGNRRYSQGDLERLQKIKTWVVDERLSTAGVNAKFANQSVKSDNDAIKRLKKIKEILQTIRQSID